MSLRTSISARPPLAEVCHRYFRPTLLTACCLLGLLTYPACGDAAAEAKTTSYRGVAITGYWFSSYDGDLMEKIIDYYHDLGFNAVELTPSWYQADKAQNVIASSDDLTPEDASLVRVIKYARQKAMKVNLKPHIELYPDGTEYLPEDLFKVIRNSPDAGAISACYVNAEPEAGPALCRLRPGLSLFQRRACLDIIRKREPSFTWRAHISPVDQAKWFKSYRCFLEHYLRIAVENRVELFTVGTEMVGVTPRDGRTLVEWTRLMAELRAYRSAHADNENLPRFLYAAHDHEIFGVPRYDETSKTEDRFPLGEPWQHVAPARIETILSSADEGALERNIWIDFWRLFDAISMTVYVPLEDGTAADEVHLPVSKAGDPVHMLQKWQKYFSEISQFDAILKKNGIDRPIIFGEIGYRSVAYGHVKPFQHTGPIFADDDSYVPESQRRAFESFFSSQAMARPGWLDGYFLWQEELKPRPDFSSGNDTGYSIIGKPASRTFWTEFIGNDLSSAPDKSISRCYGKLGSLERWDLLSGGDILLATENIFWQDGWIKARVRPYSCLASDWLAKAFNLERIDFGIWGMGTVGGGSLPKYNNTKSDYTAVAGGLTVKLISAVSAIDTDIGYGHMADSSTSSAGLYHSNQEDDYLYFFSHVDWNHPNLPKTLIDLEMLAPHRSWQQRSYNGQPLDKAIVDKFRTELCLSQNTFEIKLSRGFSLLMPVAGKIGTNANVVFGGIGVGISGINTRHAYNDTYFTLSTFYVGSGKEQQWQSTLNLDLLKIASSLLRVY